VRWSLVTIFLLSALMVGMPTFLSSADNTSLEARRSQLNKLLADEWEYEMRESPEFASMIGDYRYNDRWSDISLAHVAQKRRDLQDWLSRFQAVDTTGFPEQEKLTQQLMTRRLKQEIQEIDFKNYEMPINQSGGLQIELPQIVPILPFDSSKHYEDYLARLRQVPRLVDEVIEVLQAGEEDRLMPPNFLLEKAVAQCRNIGDPAGEASVFAQPVKEFPKEISEADRKRIHDAVIDAINADVRPAYKKLGDFLATEYAPKGRTNEGIWALPDGDARYRFAIQRMTTTDLDPETIHRLGLQEVARIEGEQLAIGKKLGFSDLKTFRAAAAKNPKYIPTSRGQILDTYRHYIAQMQPELPKLFGLLPKAKVEVRPVQEFREKSSAAADYTTGTPDGSRPGIIYVNTGDYEHRSLLSAESTAYHEGIPGHHMQLSIAQTLPGLPAFRQHAFYVAYIEGWALYAERLGKEVGFYQDPYSDYGRLSDELLRAVRLVLDTGVHHKHWTRQQMVDYFHEHSSEDEPDIQSETDRYIAWPAQALGYKLGQLEILKLRDRAQKQLGRKFDIRAFHDEILNGGALPLDVLDARVDAWIAAQKTTASGSN
jgi:uncharacterized protein (DUF885 family)